MVKIYNWEYFLFDVELFVEYSCVGLFVFFIFNILDVNDDKIMLKKDDFEFKFFKDMLK